MWISAASLPSIADGHPTHPDSEKDVRGLLNVVRQYQDPACGYKYVYMGCGDHSNNAHWKCMVGQPGLTDVPHRIRSQLPTRCSIPVRGVTLCIAATFGWDI